jgi:lipopolysaccharide transport system ATP-binding protein
MQDKKIAIRVRELGKKYQLSGTQEKYHTLRDTIVNTIKTPLQGLSSSTTNSPDFWALRNVSFDIKEGEVIGIIGRNGAGKSTLLKVLSRITTPSEGYVDLFGRVGSLLEVGTGFHPELSGRENIFLSGSIVGMKKKEIEEKFDGIVKFSEIEKFVDTPVKRYSSGMYVRLAFAVAAHLDSEILLVDEVLAVGDAQFQKKCLGKMREVSETGRTILFVSHNMNAIRNLCQRVIWLKGGMVHQTGNPDEITANYLTESISCHSISDIKSLIQSLPDDPAIRIEDIQVKQNNKAATVILNGDTVEIDITYQVLQRTIGLRVFFDLFDDRGNVLLRTYHDDGAEAIQIMEAGMYCSTVTIPANILAHREYVVNIGALILNIRTCTGGPHEGIRIPIHVETSNNINRGYPENSLQTRPLLQPILPWETQRGQ